MDRTSKVCDWCPEPRKPAVQILSLSNGRVTKNAPTLDLCSRHANEIIRKFRPRGAGGKPTHRKKMDYSKKAIAYKALWQGRTSAILDFLKKAGKPVTSQELLKGVKLKGAPRQRALTKLIKEGKIKREGWSKGTRWSAV